MTDQSRPFTSLARALIAVLIVSCASAAAAPNAAASISPSLTVAPASTQAGAASDVTVSIGYAPSPGDSPKDVRLSLAPGLLANPTATPPCPDPDSSSTSCPPVADGTVTASVAAYPVSVPAKLYLVAPHGSDLAGVELVANAFGQTITAYGGATLRSGPDVGLDLTFADLPDPLPITGLSLTLHGTVAGHAFTRLPTGCDPAVSAVTADSYSDSTVTRATSSFTPTGCGGLAYTPAVAATATTTPTDPHVALTFTLTQPAGQAATRAVTLTVPGAFNPGYTLGQECPAGTAPAACPASSVIGSAAADVSLLPSQLSGKLVLIAPAAGQALPQIGVVYAPPVPLVLVGSVQLSSSSAIQVVFDRIPDVPLTRLALQVDPSVFTAECGISSTLVADFGSWSTAALHVEQPLPVAGCPSATGADQGTPPSASGGAAKPPAPHCTVPRLRGRTLPQAHRLLSAAGCKLGPVRRRGRRQLVLRSTPPAGRIVARGARVSLVLGP